MPALYAGLMSGTSMDGIDAVLCEFEGSRFVRTRARLPTRQYPQALRERLLHLQRAKPAIPIADFCELDNAVGRLFGEAARDLAKAAGITPAAIRALGAHGQTVFHDPGGVGSSLQLGNPGLIAAVSGIDTVADFRRADIAHGGQGAPLVPAFHRAVFGDAGEERCVLNIGGIANVSLLTADPEGRVLGFDTGPGNGLMDEWIERHHQRAYDADGAWAASGRVHAPLLQALLSDEYFRRPPPKSTGRDAFNLAWLERLYRGLKSLSPADVQRSLCEFTAASIARAISEHAPTCRRVLVCGGGARNPLLMDRLRASLPTTAVEPTDASGLPASDVEAAAFAWLAMCRIEGLPGNLPSVTGARRSVVLGGLYRA